eukprot:CAMPEP_0181405122 /NCGR_PEP_ID=MMETSP1110-20121109/4600_1 /TAXON_ID=174948 /ORGANISM="Symbiodinium sp., Strain CCMP421" /LENGTH=94 /DNA_ID=CAMNT_0023527507 /DNA_START=246 /DNA_END=530 /DNA_ORIENTATION=+
MPPTLARRLVCTWNELSRCTWHPAERVAGPFSACPHRAPSRVSASFTLSHATKRVLQLTSSVGARKPMYSCIFTRTFRTLATEPDAADDATLVE